MTRLLPGPTGKAIISAVFAIGLIALLFVQVADGEYGMAVGSAFFALLNLDAGRVQWRKRGEKDVIA